MSEERRKAYLTLLTTAFIWGLAPPIIKYTLRYTSPLTFLFYRFLIVSLILIVPLTIKFIKQRPSLNLCFQYLALGFIGTPLTLLLLFFGMQKTAAINASLISIFTPILIILGGVVFLRETVTRQERFGISFIFLGAFLSILEPLFKNGLSLNQGLWGNLLIFGGSVAWASFSLLRRKAGEALDSFVLSASSFLVGLITLLPFVTFNFSLLALNSNAWPGICYMAILGSVIAYFTYIYGFSKIEASEATLFTYLEPIFAIPIAVAFLHEELSFIFLLGAFFIVIGVLVSQTRKLRLPRQFRLLIFQPKISRAEKSFKK
ncbi:MAG TPA: DMT family transporter [Patescibacteria group bacterium]|nr:DMT family transporter [Patescibacteria group bacterium]